MRWQWSHIPHDVAWEDATPFIVMELVTGQSLAKILRTHGPLPVELLALVVDGIAAGLQAAHRLHIVHRDVKPGNVLVSEHGEIKLSDFGIVRNSADPTLTKTGVMLGTAAFIAPEVAMGDHVTPSADLWSLGTTLFLAAEGHLPYDDADPLVVLSRIVNGAVPQHRQTGPIGEVLSGLMVKDPARRMPLEEVRERVHPLLPQGGANPFGSVLGLDGEHGLHGGADSVTLRHPRDGAATVTPRTPTGHEHAPTPPPDTSPPGKRSPRTLVVAVGVVLAVVLVAAGFLVFHELGEKQASGQQGQSVGDPAGSVDPYAMIQAEDYSRAVPGRDLPTHVRDDSPQGPQGTPVLSSVPWFQTMLYRHVDFGPGAARKFRARTYSLAGHDPNWAIEVRIDDPGSEPIGTLPVDGALGGWQQQLCPITPVKGTHDVYLTIVPQNGDGTTAHLPYDYVSLDWFRFEY